MRDYLVGRCLWSLVVALGVLTVIFIMMEVLPGDFIHTVVAQSPFITDEEIASLKSRLGLDRSVPHRYVTYLGGILTLDLGHSYQLDRSVSSIVAEQWPATAALAASAIVIFIPLGIGLGLLPFVSGRPWVRRCHGAFAAAAAATPSFWLGLLLIMLFSFHLGLLPSSGRGTVAHLVLPALTLAFRPAGLLARMLETALRETLPTPYITTARAKGLPRANVLMGHAFRNAIYPVIPIIGVETARLLAGTTLVETVFARPGIGRLLVDAVFQRDLPLAAGAAVVMAFACTFTNLAADIAGALLNPRIRYE